MNLFSTILIFKNVNMDKNKIIFIPIGKAQDLTGKTFGRWKVLGRAPNTEGRRGANWWCECSCDNHTVASVRGDQLTRNISTSCGCYALEIKRETGKALAAKYNAENGKNNKKDLTGQVFGRLIVLEDTRERQIAGNGTNVIWLCQCECGNTTKVTGGHLTSGHTTSCGCRKQSIGEENIERLLQEANIVYQKEFRVADCQLSTGGNPRFDFYVQERYFIEYDGEQHFDCAHHGWNNEKQFQATQQRDKEKNQYCLTNEIPLIRIPYTHLKNLTINDIILETSKFIVKE